MLDDLTLSKTMSYGLRHDPAALGLVLDPEGWADINELASALSKHLMAHVDPGELRRIVDESAKKRFECHEDSVRAAYGHSLPERIQRTATRSVPAVLFHSTDPEVLPAIRREGLRPQGRQYVHLAIDPAGALTVGRRKTRNPILLRVDAISLMAAGHSLYEAGPAVVLADHVPPEFILLGP